MPSEWEKSLDRCLRAICEENDDVIIDQFIALIDHKKLQDNAYKQRFLPFLGELFLKDPSYSVESLVCKEFLGEKI